MAAAPPVLRYRAALVFHQKRERFALALQGFEAKNSLKHNSGKPKALFF